MQKGFTQIYLLISGLIALLIGVGVYLYSQDKLPFISKPSQQACTQDAKLCPDGSYVGREDPNCEFKKCPDNNKKDDEQICIQVITPAKNQQTGECKEFPTPCDVPDRWVETDSCVPKENTSSNEQTYTDTEAGFSIRYPTTMKISTQIKGKEVGFLNCGGEQCFQGMQITLYKDYDGGSRREWLNQKFDLSTYDPYYEDLNIAGVNALVAVTRDPGSSNTVFVVIPKGEQIYLYTAPGDAIPPTQVPNLSKHKEILSTFKFL